MGGVSAGALCLPVSGAGAVPPRSRVRRPVPGADGDGGARAPEAPEGGERRERKRPGRQPGALCFLGGGEGVRGRSSAWEGSGGPGRAGAGRGSGARPADAGDLPSGPSRRRSPRDAPAGHRREWRRRGPAAPRQPLEPTQASLRLRPRVHTCEVPVLLPSTLLTPRSWAAPPPPP